MNRSDFDPTRLSRAFLAAAAEALTAESFASVSRATEETSAFLIEQRECALQDLKAFGEVGAAWEFRSPPGDGKMRLWDSYRPFTLAVIESILAHPVFNEHGISPLLPITLMEGGSNWIVPATFGSEDAVVVIPKARSTIGEILQRYRVRKLCTDAIGESWFATSRVLAIVEAPIPLCVMRRIRGDNCYFRVYDGNFDPRRDPAGSKDSCEIFKFLGEAARSLSQVRGAGFGELANNPPLNGKFASLEAYAEETLCLIEATLLQPGESMPAGLTPEMVRRLVSFARKDAKSQHPPVLVHGDFRPWNVLHDRERGLWAVMDWDEGRLGTSAEQLGIALTGMRREIVPEWAGAILDGYECADPGERKLLLARASAWGACMMSLRNAARCDTPDLQHFKRGELASVVPLSQLFLSCGVD